MSKRIMPLVSLAALAIGSMPSGALGFPRADGGAGNIEKLLADVKSELTRVGDDVKRTAEDALKQSKQSAAVSDEVKASADKLLTQQNVLQSAHDKLTGKLEAIESRQTDIEQAFAARRPGGVEAAKSAGQIVAEHADLKAFVERGAKGAVSITVNQVITSSTSSAGDLIAPDREREIVRLPRRQMTIRQLLMPGSTGSNLVQYSKQTTRTNNARVQTEGETKGESSYVWDLAEAPVRDIAHFVIVSRQALADAAQLQSEIDGELAYGLDYAEELEILSGSGVAPHLSGLITEATAYSAAFAVTGETMIDKLRLAMLQASLAEFPADGAVIHPTDWARIELTKDEQMRYLFANPLGLAGPTLWGNPVVPTQAITVDKFLVGAFRMAAQIYDRQGTEILLSSEDGDNFKKNLVTVRAEKRLALAIKRALALIYGDFGNVG